MYLAILAILAIVNRKPTSNFIKDVFQVGGGFIRGNFEEI
jgi:hypothetical protein